MVITQNEAFAPIYVTNVPKCSRSRLKTFKRVLETALLAASAAAGGRAAPSFRGRSGFDTVREARQTSADWSGAGLELVQTAGGWRFQTRQNTRCYLDLLKEQERREVFAARPR